MKYRVLDYKLPKIEKLVNRIKRKGVNVVFEVGEPCEIAAENCSFIKAAGHEVEIDAFYKINGWEFVATIEHTENGNIIRCVNSDLESKIPSKYKTCGPECEHCHRIRNRKDTYLVYNSEKDEFKQVGKSCLQEYTDGLDANLCAELASTFLAVADAHEFGVDDEFRSMFSSGNVSLDSNDFKKLAYTEIKKNGYQKEGKTVDKVIDQLLGKEKGHPATEDEIQKVTDFANSVDADYGYIYNAKLAWLKKYADARDFALIASFISVYFRELERIEKEKLASESTHFVGEVGDRISIDIASIRALYVKDNRQYSYYAKPSTVYSILDNEGNTYICDTATDLLDAKKITATIKSHSEYRGVKQTIITRVKVTESNVSQSATNNSGKAIDELVDYLDK